MILHKAIGKAVIGLVFLLPIADRATAAGFAIKEQSGAALGNAFAGATAGAEDISYMFFNPAALALQSGNQVLAVASYIAPRSELGGGTASTVTATPIGGNNGGNDIADDAVVPALYAMWDVNANLKFGVGVNAPWGLVTNYNDNWIGRYHAVQSTLKTTNINPVVAYKFNDMLSVAAGLQAQFIDAKLTNAIDFGSIDAVLLGGAFGGVPTQNDGTSKAKGDDWGFGYNLGLLFEPIAGTRIGVAYRSKVSHELDGSVRFNTGGPVGAGISGATGQFIDTGAKASVTLPEIVSFGIHQDINAQWSVMAEGSWTRWSRFDELRFRFENPLQADSVTDEDWHNAWFGALGATYRATNGWTFRGGVAFDESPIPDRTRTPRLPGSDRYWIAIGAKKSLLPNLDLDVGYTHIFLDDATVGLTTGGTGNTFRGNLSGEYDSSIDIFTLQVTYRF